MEDREVSNWETGNRKDGCRRFERLLRARILEDRSKKATDETVNAS